MFSNQNTAVNDCAHKTTHRHTTLVINWHITEACNYRCQYCYAEWAKPERHREVIHDAAQTKNLLKELVSFFHPGNQSNPLRKNFNWTRLRLNFAGGEPLLYPRQLIDAIIFARQLGMETSVITNGSRLTSSITREISPLLSLLGLSIDSLSPLVNHQIGRMDNHGRTLHLHQYHTIIKEARDSNPQLRIKINTVINKMNHWMNMAPVVGLLQPEKWKVLRMLPMLDRSLAVTQNEFDRFIFRHRNFSSVMTVEDNSDMTDSYIMIDPAGRFYQNSLAGASNTYIYSPSILTEGAAAAFACIPFSADKYSARYLP